MTSFNPIRDLALWLGSLAPEGWELQFQLAGLVLPAVAVLFIICAGGDYLAKDK